MHCNVEPIFLSIALVPAPWVYMSDYREGLNIYHRGSP